MSRWSARLVIVAIVLCAMGVPVLAADGASMDQQQTLWTTALAWLVPVGLGLLACGTVPSDRVASVIRVSWLALGVSIIGYWLCGFAFHFGGLGFVFDQPDLAGLVRQWNWSPLDPAWGTEWGILGLEGYLLRTAGLAPDGALAPTMVSLFLSQLPWITTAVAIPLWSLQGRARPFALFLSSLLSAFVYSLVGNWVSGGGWLANLGANLGLGHGFVDLAGAGTIHLIGGASALAGMLAFGARPFMRRAEQLPLPTIDAVSTQDARASGLAVAPNGETYVPMPSLHLPIFATLGTWLVVIGWVGWAWSTPVQVIAGLEFSWTEMVAGLMLAVAGAALAALLFSWLTTGQGNALMTARGVLGAVVAASAGLPFVPLWAALAIGAGAGLLVPLVQYLIDHVLRLDDFTSAVAAHLVPGLWGLLAVGIFADGRVGQGWNQTGLGAYLDVDRQGVTGLIASTGYASDWPGQFQAQAIGAAALFLTAFFVLWLLFAAIQSLTRAWQGEYAIRLPRRKRAKPTRPRGTRTRQDRTARALRRARVRAAPTEAPQEQPEQPPAETLGAETSTEPRRRSAILGTSAKRIVERVRTRLSRWTRARRNKADEPPQASPAESSEEQPSP